MSAPGDRFSLASLRLPPLRPIDVSRFPSTKHVGYTMYSFSFDAISGGYRGPGEKTELQLYLPDGQWGRGALPCVLVPPAGTMLIHGLHIDRIDDNPEHVPYLALPCAVVSFSLDGDFDIDRGSLPRLVDAYRKFRDAMAGLANAKIAFECAKRINAIDPARIFIAGHSSAATLALLFAEHEPLLAGAMAYAPEVDMVQQVKDIGTDISLASFPGIREFGVRSSPLTHVGFLKSPLFLYHAAGDRVTSAAQTRRFANELRATNRNVEFVTGAGSSHYQTMIAEGIPKALVWLKRQIGETPGAGAPPVRYTFEVRKFFGDEAQAAKDAVKALKSVKGYIEGSAVVDYAAKRLTFELSGGEQNRLAAVRALSSRGNLVLNPLPVSTE